MLLLRHAATAWNDQHRRMGWADQPLTPAGRRAAGKWAARANQELSSVCCSDLERARETARIIASALGLGEVVEMRGLREQRQGAWTGLTKEQIKARWPERLRERPRRPVGGESPEAVLERVLTALARLAKEHPGRRIVAVTHSDVIRTLERAMAVASPPVPHLQGRWITVCVEGRPRPGPALDMLGAGPLTDGRLAPVPADRRPLEAGHR